MHAWVSTITTIHLATLVCILKSSSPKFGSDPTAHIGDCDRLQNALIALLRHSSEGWTSKEGLNLSPTNHFFSQVAGQPLSGWAYTDTAPTSGSGRTHTQSTCVHASFSSKHRIHKLRRLIMTPNRLLNMWRVTPPPPPPKTSSIISN